MVINNDKLHFLAFIERDIFKKLKLAAAVNSACSAWHNTFHSLIECIVARFVPGLRNFAPYHAKGG